MLGEHHVPVAIACELAAEHLLGTEVSFTEALAVGLQVPLGGMHLTPTATVEQAAAATLAMSATLLLGAGVGFLAGLAPDLDSPTSTLGKMLPAWWHELTPGHRGPTHSLFFLGLWTALVAPLAFLFHTALIPELVFTGYASHLAMDGVTDQGVPLFWLPPPLVALVTAFMPREWARAVRAFVRWRVRTPITFTTGKRFEKWVATPGFVLLALYLGGVFDPVLRMFPLPHAGTPG